MWTFLACKVYWAGYFTLSRLCCFEEVLNAQNTDQSGEFHAILSNQRESNLIRMLLRVRLE